MTKRAVNGALPGRGRSVRRTDRVATAASPRRPHCKPARIRAILGYTSFPNTGCRNEMRQSTRLLLLALTAPAVFAGAAVGADDDWLQCGPGFEIPERPALEAAESDADPGTIHVSADEADLVEDGVSRFTGNVTVEQDSRQLQSDVIVYDQSEEVIEAEGNVRLWDQGVFLTGPSARADIEQDVVTFGPAAEYMLEDEHGHGDAAEIRTQGRERMTASDVSYTTCNPGEADWRITAREVVFDRVESTGTARDMWLEFMGQRVFHLPWISFPLGSQRKSGFLSPTFGTSGSSGVEVTVPYYFNLAPNYDATLTAHTMSDRGVQAQGEFRFLSRTYGIGQIAAEHLPSDSQFDDDRTAFDLVHRHQWSDRWSTDGRFEWVSDDEYLEDFGSSLSQSSRTHLPRRFDANYRGDGWRTRVRFQDFMTLDRSINRPYARLPQVLVRTNLPQNNHAPNFDTTAELTYFDHESRTTGARMDLQPALTYPMRSAGAFVIPKATLHITGYNLNRTATEAARDDAPSRLLPSFSLDSGLFLERPVSLLGKSLTHTIEPRIYYLLVPYDGQDDLPRFDTSRPTFSFAQLFRENRFSGEDRIGDANQVTVALASRLLDDSGGELARAGIGQIHYLRDRRVTLAAGDEPETTNRSDLVGEIEARPSRNWRLRAGLQYDTSADRTEKHVLTARYQPNRRSVINAGYRLVRDINPTKTIEQADLSFAWPLGPDWRTVGRWSFALNEDSDQTLEAFGGLEYESCCWGFRTVVRRFRSGAGTDGTDNYSTGLFLQLELKGLTNVGNRTEALLTRGIPGYENEF